MKRRSACLFALMGLLAVWLMLGSPAQAAVPPPPVVTTPAAATFTVHVSDQPIHFAGTVAGPVSNVDQIHVDRFDPPNDPPELCNFVLMGVTNWSCTSAVTYPVGDYNLRVVWLANDPSYLDMSSTSLTLHIVPNVVPPPPPPPVTTPPPPPPPVVHHHRTPVVVPITHAPTFAATTVPTPTPTPTPQPAALPAPIQILPGLPATPLVAAAPLKAWNPFDHPRQVLGLGVAAFTMLTLVGPTGLAMSSMAGIGLAVAAGAAGAAAASAGGKGSVSSAKVKSHKFAAEGAGPGDLSWSWRLPGWQRADAVSFGIPVWLASRSPLTARVMADGSYLRAIFGMAWAALMLVGGGLGLAAAHQTRGVPIAPSLGLTAALLVIAIFDAAAGGAGVIGFLVGMAIWPSNELSVATSIRSFLGLAALWFAIPLIAAAARPFRRSVLAGSPYAWDRLADTVIATLIAGWAVQKTIGGLPGLSGLDLPIGHEGDKLALIAMAAVVIRVLVEELAAQRYPLRLLAVQQPKLPFAGNRQRWFATGVRTVLFVFLVIAFIGNSWQLWVGALLFVIPQALSIYEQKFPNSERLHGMLPGGILKILLMLIVGTLFARLVFSILTSPESMLRNGFILMTIPGLILSGLGLYGRDGPDPAWTWPRQFAGVVVLGAILCLVLTGW